MFQLGQTIEVQVAGRPLRRVAAGTAVRDILDGPARDDRGLPYLGALVNNDCVTLEYPIEVDSDIEFITLRHPHGWRIYRSSLAFLLAKAVRETFPAAAFAVEHSLGNGFYCSFSDNGTAGIRGDQLERLDAALRDLVQRDLPIQRRKIAFQDAVEGFERTGQHDKFDLLRFHNPPKVPIYECDGFADLAHTVLADRTGVLGDYALIHYPPGFVLQLPDRENPPRLASFEPEPHLFQIFREHKEWGRILGVRTVGDLNRLIAAREIDDIIRTSEAFHEKKLAQVADHIAGHRDRIKWVLIAGPSSSGKTTFSKRLAVQLRVNGLRPVAISVDDYFVERSKTPRDDGGQPDFEHIEALDLELFNRHLAALDRGEEVELPSFDFTTGERVFKGRTLRIEEDQLVIVEGIHGLNPRLTAGVPAEHKFKIYVSALTGLNLDYHNRVATTDNRLLRRLVRDHMFRGHSALRTLEMWPSVRRGEKRWIFPFQNQADLAFNSALDYELAVLKPFAEPLLCEVKPLHPQYAEARRLLRFLESFLGMPFLAVPPNSILREFIGRSAFRY